MRTAFTLVLGAALCAAPLAPHAESPEAALPAALEAVSSAEQQSQARLIAEFSGFAGSDANARSLITGLRQGEEITLIAPGSPGHPGAETRFAPPTRPMDYGNVRIALVLAREQLAQLEITQPTPSQISAVLAGGGIASRTNGRAATPYLYPGVLQMRAGGMNWSKIAATMGITLAQAMNGRIRPADVPESPDSRRPAAAAGSLVPVAGARTEASAQRRSSAGSAPISAASITTSSAGAPRTATPALAIDKEAAPLRPPPRAQPGPETRPAGTGVLAAREAAATGEKSAAPRPAVAQDGPIGIAGAAAAPAAAQGSGGPEEGLAAE